MQKEELKALTNQTLLENYKKAVELDFQSSGNGKNPFDQNQLKEEILLRLQSKNELTLTILEDYDIDD